MHVLFQYSNGVNFLLLLFTLLYVVIVLKTSRPPKINE